MRAIDADGLNKVKFHPLPYTHITPSDVEVESYKRGWNDAVDAIMTEAPTIEPERTGKWIRIYSRPNVLKYLGWTCSECGARTGEEHAPQWFKYCPTCGAQMEAGEQE